MMACALTPHLWVERIKEDQDYEGIRVTFLGYLEDARLPVQIDIGFGDAITPDPIQTSFPTLLRIPPPFFAYPRETVVAEKFEALVKLGIANTRMKDFHDLKTLSSLFHLPDRPSLKPYGAPSRGETHRCP